MTTLLKLILLTSCPTLALLATVAHGVQSVTLAWGPVSTATGYKIYWGTQSNALSSSLSVGAVTNATVSGLVEGTQYWFGATALSNTLESVMSLEIAYTVPLPNGVTLQTNWLSVWSLLATGKLNTQWSDTGFKWTNPIAGQTSCFYRGSNSFQIFAGTYLETDLTTTAQIQIKALPMPPNPMGAMK